MRNKIINLVHWASWNNDKITFSDLILIQEVIHTPFVPVLQSAFQPSSTPVHLMHRFMVG